MSKRNDAHSPANLVTEDYDFVLAGDNNPPEGCPGWVMQYGDFGLETSRRLARTGVAGRGTSQCHHCGAHLRYFAIMEHRPTGDLIAIGETCLDNRFDRATSEFHKLRKQAQLDREQQRIRGAVAEFAAANPDLAFMADKDHDHTNSFVADVARNLRRYGNLTERQVEAVRKSLARDAAAAAAPVVPPAPVVPVVEGRGEITGTIVSLKWQDSSFGTVYKMLVKDDRGFKVWGTVPAGLDNPNRDDRIAFTATTTRSNDDEAFGFFSRPAKPRYLA